jgi:hypothetical protein
MSIKNSDQLVDFGYMPPKRRLTTDEVAELKAWLDQKP